MTNASGVEIETTEYMPFGSQRNHSGTNTSAYKFTDQELDAENGLYNYNARLYDPIIGRFISLDTIVPDSYNPQSLNRYSYCLNNPLIYTDPSGHQQMPFEAYAQLIAMMNTLCALFPSSAGLLSGSGTCFLTGFEVQAVNTESMELAQFLDEARSSSGVGGGGTNPITSSNYDPNNSDPDYRNRAIHEAIKQSGYIGEFDLNSKDFKKKIIYCRGLNTYGAVLEERDEGFNAGDILMGPDAFQSFDFLAITIGHELVHYKQWQANKLCHGYEPCKWANEAEAYKWQYDNIKKFDLSTVPYEKKRLIDNYNLYLPYLGSYW